MDIQKILAGKPPLRTIPGIACRRHPIVYCSIPKAGCTTIKHLMYYIDNGTYYPDHLAIHNDPKALLWARSEERDKYIEAMQKRKITFTFVREPFARAYSAFNEKIHFNSKYSFPMFRAMLVKEYGAVFPDTAETITLARHSDNWTPLKTSPFRLFSDSIGLCDLQGADDAWTAWVLGFGRTLQASECRG